MKKQYDSSSYKLSPFTVVCCFICKLCKDLSQELLILLLWGGKKSKMGPNKNWNFYSNPWKWQTCWQGFNWTNKVFKFELITCSMLTISTLLKKMNEVSVDKKFSSKTDGVGRMISWMYCTRYVWWIFCLSSESVIGITSLNLAVLVRNSRWCFGWTSAGSYSRQPTTSIIQSSENITSKSAALLRNKTPRTIS